MYTPAEHMEECTSSRQAHIELASTEPTSSSSRQEKSRLTANNIHLFQSFSGPTTIIPNSLLDIFQLFFTEQLQQQIVQATNDYAKETMKEELWTKVTCDELRAYFGFHILMSIYRLPSIDDYWSTNPNLRYAPVANRITRDRFRDLQKYFHFADNDTLVPRGQRGYDRLGKV